ncbi:MAG: putative type IX secretion system sortase PorU2 [Luteibaculaceae bacterium]
MFRFIVSLLCFFFIGNLSAQIFGNEWINYGQQYYSFKVWQDGVYRLSKTQLEQAGVPVNSIDPRNFQLFAEERQVPILVVGEEDGSFNETDFIEFFARRNSGFFDVAMYTQPQFLPDEEFSLINDTIRYFLTWNTSLNNARVQQLGAGNFTGYTPENWVFTRSRIRFNDAYLLGDRSNLQITLPAYVEGEGWFGTNIARGQNRDVILQTPNAFTGSGAPSALVRAVTTANSNPPGSPNHRLRISFGPSFTTAVDTSYTGFRLCRFSFAVPPSALGATTNIRFTVVDDLGLSADNQNISHVEITYPRNTNLSGLSALEIRVPFNPTRPGRMIQVSNFSVQNAVAYVVRQNSILKISAQETEPGVWRFIVPNAPDGATQRVLLKSDNTALATSLVRPINNTGFFRNFMAEASDSVYVIITNNLLLNAAQGYAAYRSAHPNYPYNTLVVDVNELYNQFGAGIEKHPRAIRRFARYLLNNYPTDPSHFFLVGKAISARFTRFGAGAPANFANTIVPTYGVPPSDAQLVAGLTGNLLEPSIPIGRLAVRFPTQVNQYLAKVQALENTPPSEWTKRNINFGGGANVFEQNQFRNFLRGYENRLAGPFYGVQTSTFLKTSSAPVQITTSDSIRNLIEGGVMLMNFFGHSSSSGFDQNIDNPANYNNQGKYPLLVSNGCFSGDIHLPGFNSISEQFVTIPNRGSIGFLATVDLGLASLLNQFSSRFYQNLTVDHYGRTLGQIVKATKGQLQGQNPSRELQNTLLTFTLHGDPGIRLYAWQKPDLAISNERVTFEPNTITQEIDSLDVRVVISNLGKTTNQEFAVTLVRRFPNNLGDSTYTKVRNGIIFRDTVIFRIPAFTNVAAGINSFDVYVDVPGYQIDELDNDGNNVVLGRELFISAAEAQPVFPGPYAILPNNAVKLTASTGNPLAEEKNYIFQIDTLRSFNSSFMQQHTVMASGGVIEWNIPFVLQEEKVYYWRVGPQEALNDEELWRDQSFRYTPNKSGWGQSHRQQMRNNSRNFITFNEAVNEYEYQDGLVTFFASAFNNATNQAEFIQNTWGVNTSILHSNGCTTAPSLHIAIVDPNTLEPWLTATPSGQNASNQFGNGNNLANCGSQADAVFIFRKSSVQGLRGLDSLLKHVVPDGFHIIGHTFPRNRFDLVEANYPQLFETLSDLGIVGLSGDMPNAPVCFYARKGSPELSSTLIGTAIPEKQRIDLEVTVPVPLGSGTVQSIRTTPFASLLEVNASLEENGTGNAAILNLNTIPPQSTPPFSTSGFSISESIEGLGQLNNNPLRFTLRLNSPPNTQPAQLRKWEVIAENLNTELAVDAASGFYWPRDSVQEGDILSFSMPFKNVSTTATPDSVSISYQVESLFGGTRFSKVKRVKPLEPGEVYFDTLKLNTQGLEGRNILRFEVNPIGSNGSRGFLENFFSNNLVQKNFRVGVDAFNPLLDVTFDGMRIINGELVSANPFITMVMEDENPFLMMDSFRDTVYFQVFITKPSGSVYRVFFLKGNGEEQMRFIPASGSTNKVTIEYHPNLEEDGEYTLRVQARDKSGNQAGSKDYRIQFNVINKSTITQLVNYPNPFSTRTQFVFTLTGSQLPDYLKIQIMTITGKVVKEIFMDELGPIRIGNNRTSYWWDGTDNFGDKLANGVYLYRVVTKINGEQLERKQTGADRFFKEEMGKMYIMR